MLLIIIVFTSITIMLDDFCVIFQLQANQLHVLYILKYEVN